jgi:hypothetical protein
MSNIFFPLNPGKRAAVRLKVAVANATCGEAVTAFTGLNEKQNNCKL